MPCLLELMNPNILQKKKKKTLDGGSGHCTGDRDQDHPQEKEMQKSRMGVWRDLTNTCEKKGSEKQRRKGMIYPFECSVPKNNNDR